MANVAGRRRSFVWGTNDADHGHDTNRGHNRNPEPGGMIDSVICDIVNGASHLPTDEVELAMAKLRTCVSMLESVLTRRRDRGRNE